VIRNHHVSGRLDEVLYLFLTLNLWLSLGAGVMVVISALALAVPIEAVGLGVAIPPLLAYVIYVEDRRSVSPEDWANHPTRTELVRRYRHALLGTELLALLTYQLLLVGLVRTSPGVGGEYVLLGQVPFAVLAAYDRLKRGPSLDSLAVGGTWSFAIVFTLLVTAAAPPSPAMGLVFLGWFVIVFAGVESRNIDDIDGDSAADRRTLAGTLGPRRMRRVVVGLKAAGVGLFWFLGGVVVAAAVIGYLALLWGFRRMTSDAHA
jgi:hypothetical protein